MDFVPPSFAAIGIRFLSWLISLLGQTRVTDPTSGFRCAGPARWRDFAERYPDDYPETGILVLVHPEPVTSW